MHIQESTFDASPVTLELLRGRPLLFLMYINMPSCIKNSFTTRLFADDAIIYHQIRSKGDSRLLQEDLECLQQWESDWRMTFHPQEFQTIRASE